MRVSFALAWIRAELPVDLPQPLKGAVRMLWPRPAPGHQALYLVPVPLLRPEALRGEGPGGQHDMGVRVLALPAVEGDISDHPTVHKGALRVAHERAAVPGPQLGGNRHANLAGDLHILPALGRFDRVPQTGAVLRPRGRISRGQNLGPVEGIALAVVMLLASGMSLEPLAKSVFGRVFA